MKDIIVKGKIEFSEEKNKQYNRTFTATLGDTAAYAYGNRTRKTKSLF